MSVATGAKDGTIKEKTFKAYTHTVIIGPFVKGNNGKQSKLTIYESSSGGREKSGMRVSGYTVDQIKGLKHCDVYSMKN